MIPPLLRLSAALAALVVVPGLGRAATAPAPGTQVIAPCAAATLENCSAPAPLGPQCRATFPDQCRTLLVDATAALTASWPTVTALRPPGTSAPYTLAPGVRVQDTPPKVGRVVGTGSNLLGSAAQQTFNYQSGNGLGLDPTSGAVGCLRTAWASTTGQRSCAEYAFERFPRLAELEAVIDKRQGQVPALLDDLAALPYMNADPLVNDPSFPDNERLRALGPVTVGQYVRYQTVNGVLRLVERVPARFSKNVFADLATAFLDRKTLGLRGDSEPGAHATATERPGEYPKKAATPLDVGFPLAVLAGATQSLTIPAQVTIRNTLRAAGHSEATIRQLAALQESFATTWQKRQDAFTAYYAMRKRVCYGAIPVDLNSALPTVNFECNDGTWLPWAAAKALVASYDDQLVAMLRAARGFGCLSATTPSACDWSPEVAFQTILTGRPANFDSLPPPAGFVRSGGVSDFQARRLAEQQRCAQLTKATPGLCVGGTYGGFLEPGDLLFACQGGQRLALYPGLIQGWEQWPQNKTALSVYLTNVERAQAAVLEYQEMLQKGVIPSTTVGGNRVVGVVRSGNEGLFLDILGKETGGGYDYRAGWWLTGVKPLTTVGVGGLAGCPAGVAGVLDFGVDAKLMGTTLRQYRFLGNVDSNRGQRQFVVRFGGTDVAVQAPFFNEAAPFESHLEALLAEQIGPTLQTMFMVVFVPLTLRLYVMGEVGAVVAASYADVNCSTMPGTVYLDARQQLEPRAQLSLVVSVSVDLGLAEGGVRGAMALVTLGLPFGVTTKLDYRPDKAMPPSAFGQPTPLIPAQAWLAGSSSLDLRAGTLAGRLTAFAEVKPFGPSLEVPIIDWSGVEHRWPLSAAQVEVPVATMYQALGGATCATTP